MAGSVVGKTWAGRGVRAAGALAGAGLLKRQNDKFTKKYNTGVAKASHDGEKRGWAHSSYDAEKRGWADAKAYYAPGQ